MRFGIGSWELGIYDVAGREVLKQRIENQKSKIIAHAFSPGIYFVKVKSDEGKEHVQKMIIE
jgi:hypothetical protein